MIIYMENQLNYEIYHSLRESVGWKNFQEEQAKKAIHKSLYDLVVYDDSTAVAMARMIGDGLYCVIVDVVVTPAYQHRGIGTELMKRLLDYVDRETPVGGRVSIQLIAEKGKEPFYEKLGFQMIPHEYCGSGMRKVLHK